MFVKTTDKWTLAKAFINTWLRDQTWYCNNCDMDYNPLNFPCCEKPQVGRNIDHLKGMIKENKIIQQTRKNEFASTDNKTLRWGISLPPRLYYALDKYFRSLTEGEKLFKDNQDLHEFMKEFPQFCIPEKI